MNNNTTMPAIVQNSIQVEEDILPGEKQKKLVTQKKRKAPTEKVNININDPLSMMAYMIKTETLSIKQMGKLMDLRERMESEKSRKAFLAALSKFQAECPEIEKNTTVYNKDGTIRYKYAKIGQIVKQIKNPLERNGLSYFFEYKQGKEQKTQEIIEKGQKSIEEYTEYYVDVICHICHVDGYEKTGNPVRVPIDEKLYMSDIQKIGTAHSYGDRYSLSGALGIVTHDEDIDGNDSRKGIQNGNKNGIVDNEYYRKLFTMAIVGLLCNPVFSDEERKQFKNARKKFRTLIEYQHTYNKCLQEKMRRKNENSKLSKGTSQ